MTTLTFKKVDTIQGIKRIMTIKENVNGYRKTNTDNSVIFHRGKINYTITLEQGNYTFTKYNYSTANYEVFEYDDIRKFFDFSN